MTSHLSFRALGELDDEELVGRFQGGDPAALDVLVKRYRGLARAQARKYFLVGSDVDDVEQEGLIGLYEAARDFRSDQQSSFPAFAGLCMTRQVISAIKAAGRHKHQPLNQYLSMSRVALSDNPAERSVEDLLEDHHGGDPADAVISNEQIGHMRRAAAGCLSVFEIEVLRLHVDGQSYQEISADLGRHIKSIDNALQRIKRKLDRLLQDDRSEKLPATTAA